jgi:hypothetical protein
MVVELQSVSQVGSRAYPPDRGEQGAEGAGFQPLRGVCTGVDPDQCATLRGGLDAPIAVTLTLSGTDQLSLTGLTGENRGFDDAGDGGSVDNVMLAAGAT